jgi:hypothetical protein
MAQRLGISREAVEAGRRELKRLGLLSVEDRGRGRACLYLPALPDGCVPSQRPTPTEVTEIAKRLEAHIRGIRAGVTQPDAQPPAVEHNGKQPRSPIEYEEYIDASGRMRLREKMS